MNWLKKIALVAVFTIPCIKNVGAEECALFDESQRDVLQSAYDYGKQHSMGWTMAAIAWSESSAGKRPVNWNDPSFGVYHVLLKNAAHYEGVDISNNPLQALSIAARLVYDHDYAAKQSFEVLAFWHKYHEGDWHKTWASYNEGFNWSGEKGRTYSVSINKKIKYLQSNNCIVR
ncbi:MAG: hypothetical protein ACRC91_04750 [Aeromonas sp.]